jgi:rfaE bifunctional protein kinase chain/domain
MLLPKDFADLEILVVGDVMLDRYWWGTVSRISPEAPVPIINLGKMTHAAGGAANVAANLVGLGAKPFLYGIKGNDAEGELLEEVLLDAGLGEHEIATVEGRKTTTKTRIVAHSQHVARIDNEDTSPLATAEADKILPDLFNALARSHALIISDYAKGFLTERLLRELISYARKNDKLVVVDPKGRDFSKYKGASVITPNKREAAEACGLSVEEHDVTNRAGEKLLKSLGLQGLLITEGEHGMSLFEPSGKMVHFDSLARDVYDVTGAGDTVIATFTASAASGSSYGDAAQLANAAAGVVVGMIGTTRVTREMISDFADTPISQQIIGSAA